jgi:hypothetical protein
MTLLTSPFEKEKVRKNYISRIAFVPARRVGGIGEALGRNHNYEFTIG